MQKPQYPNASSYMTLKRDVLPRGVKVITNAVRPDMAYVEGIPYETYISFTVDGSYDCSAVRWKKFEEAMKYHDLAVNVLREAIHA